MLRNTRQRQLILDTLRKTPRHPTADELYEQVRPQLPSISLGTVYRNLDLLVRLGEVRKMESAGGPAHYDADLRPHQHVWCSVCGAVDDVFDLAVAPARLPGTSAHGFQIAGLRIEFQGLCPACQEKERRSHD